MFRFGLQTRLLIAMGLLATAAVAAVGLVARQSARQEFERFQTIERVRDRDEAGQALARISAALDGRCCGTGEVQTASVGIAPDRAVFVFDDQGALLEASGPAVPGSGVTATYRAGVVSIETRSTEPGTQSGLSMSLKGAPMKNIRRSDGSSATVHLLPWGEGRSGGESPTSRFQGSVDRSLMVATSLVAAIALLFTWAAARQILGPIAELRDATRDLTAGRLARRVHAEGSAEVAELARSFNVMAEGLERQVALRRDLVHDVAHELRTPLTALRCRIETVLDGLAEDPRTALREVNEDVAHLSRLVNDLEDLAHAEARDLAFSIDDVDVAAACRSAIRAAGLEGGRRLRLELDGEARSFGCLDVPKRTLLTDRSLLPPRIPVASTEIPYDGLSDRCISALPHRLLARADPTRLRQVLVNLLTNADRHTPPDGVIVLRSARRESRVIIEVHNSGSSLTSSELERVFDRFYRADPSRQRATGGSGLGLAIVKHLVEAQSGTVAARSDDNGVTFEVTFPVVA